MKGFKIDEKRRVHIEETGKIAIFYYDRGALIENAEIQDKDIKDLIITMISHVEELESFIGNIRIEIDDIDSKIYY